MVLTTTLSFTWYSFAQVQWKTFNEKNAGLSMQIPSDWIPIMTPEEEKWTPIDVYAEHTTKNGSFASIEVFGSGSEYYDQKDSIADSLSEYENETNYKLLNPIECGTYALNKLPACSFVVTYQDDGQPQTVLDVLAIDQKGIEYETEFVASSDFYDRFFPAAEHMIKSISFDPDKVASVLNSTSAGNTNLLI